MVMRVGGLASGMDIDSIVEKLMTAERAPLDKLVQQKQKYEWQRDSYRDVNKQLKAFDDFLFPGMTLQKDFYNKSVVSSNTAISATPTTAESGQSLSIEKVIEIAKSGNVVGKVSAGTSGSTEIGSALGSTAFVDGKAEISMDVLQEDGSMKAVNVTINATDTIDQVVSKLKSGTGLNAFYDKASGQLAISTKATGAGELINPTDPSSTAKASVVVKSGNSFFTALGISDSQALIKNGKDAEIVVNGATINRNSNTFEVDGFKVTLNDTYSGAQPISLTTKVDADNMVDKIKKFVDTYNGLVDSLTALTKEPKYRDFPPLTEEQKKEMDEKEIEAWEKKAKSGTLRGDQLISSVLSSMRTTMYSSGGGKQDNRAAGENFINSLYEMGITTSDKVSDNGKLKIDEEKLRAAIEKDPDQVFKTFSDTTAGNEGIVQKLRKNIDSTVKNIEKKAGKSDSTNLSFNIGRSLDGIEDRIDAWKTKLANIEQRYWKQFSAMEQAISKANTQSSNLFSGQQ